MATYYIGADVHSNSTELAIESRKKIVATYSVPTTIPAISNVLDSLQGQKHLTIEEGPMAGWLYRNLNKKVDALLVCDPPVERIRKADLSLPDYNCHGLSSRQVPYRWLATPIYRGLPANSIRTWMSSEITEHNSERRKNGCSNIG